MPLGAGPDLEIFWPAPQIFYHDLQISCSALLSSCPDLMIFGFGLPCNLTYDGSPVAAVLVTAVQAAVAALADAAEPGAESDHAVAADQQVAQACLCCALAMHLAQGQTLTPSLM